jgi:hypothetical protein
MRTSILPRTILRTSSPLHFLSALYHRNFRFLRLFFTCAIFAQRMDGMVLGWQVLSYVLGISGVCSNRPTW